VTNPLAVVVAGVAGRMGREVARIAAEDPAFALLGGLEAAGHPLAGKTLREAGAASDAPIATELEQLAGAGARGTRAGGPCPGVLIEFCLGEGALRHAGSAAGRGFAIVSGSTAFTPEMEAALRSLGAVVPVVRSANFSLGALALMRHGAALAAELGTRFDVEIVESHHRGKRDVPSGTALALAAAIRAARGASGNDVVGRRPGDPTRAAGEIGIHGVRAGSLPGEHRLLIAGDGETLEITHRVYGREAFARGALHAATIAAGLPPGYYQGLDVLEVKAT
jgi:4-hydroxy-tetrahydrodipicolinate reductase